MKTVEEILKESGLSDEQIKALDAKVVSGLTTVVTSASQTLDAAELAKRAQSDQYETQIAPALDNWANEKASYDAKIAAYDAALKSAKEGGFKVPDILATPAVVDPHATRGADGKFVANANAVPGSPQFEQTLRKEIGTAFSFAADVQWRYQKLYGTVIPDSPTALIGEAVANHMTPMAWAEKKYDFPGKEAAQIAADRKKETDAAVSAAVADNDKKWAEKVGSNPDVRRAEVSKFSEINKAVKAGTRPDPLAPGLSEAQRDANTRAAIRAEVASQTVQ